jgi:hypothetical protein
MVGANIVGRFSSIILITVTVPGRTLFPWVIELEHSLQNLLAFPCPFKDCQFAFVNLFILLTQVCKQLFHHVLLHKWSWCDNLAIFRKITNHSDSTSSGWLSVFTIVQIDAFSLFSDNRINWALVCITNLPN